MRSPDSYLPHPVVAGQDSTNVLVVEDDDGIATQLVRGLTRGGYQASGQTA
jgi:hypothetical protein